MLTYGKSRDGRKLPSNSPHKMVEHRTLLAATIKAEGIFIKVHLQVLPADASIHAAYAVLVKLQKPSSVFTCASPST